MSTPPELIDSATVVLVRDQQQQLEVLMLKKNQSINYGGRWVFPGGVIETHDVQIARQTSGHDRTESAARIAAVRETREESGIELQANQLQAFAHWTTPKLRAKRYATWFFISDANGLDEEISIDDQEIVEAQWFTPQQALAAQAAGTVQLTGPSFVTLSELSKCGDVSQALEFYQKQTLNVYKPQGLLTEDAAITLYQADSAYHLIDQGESVVLTSQPPLHRLYMYRTGAWKYVKSGVTN